MTLPHDTTPETIAIGLREFIERGDAKRQLTSALKAHNERLIELDVALALMGELEPRKCGMLEP